MHLVPTSELFVFVFLCVRYICCPIRASPYCFVRLYLTLPLLQNQIVNGTPKTDAGSVSVVARMAGTTVYPFRERD